MTEAAESTYIAVRNSQVRFFKAIPLYYQAKEEFRLYKKPGARLDEGRADALRHPKLFIRTGDKKEALKDLIRGLNGEFAGTLAAGGLVEIRTALENIVQEVLSPGQEDTMPALPETLDILFRSMKGDHTAMGYLSQIAGTSSLIVAHTVNVTALTLQYCFFMGLSRAEAGRLGLCALLHDVGTATLDRAIVESSRRLTEKEFKLYQTHVEAGHDMIILNTDFDISISTVAMEHHERLDKSGYPHGIDTICEESQLIGMIDSYEALSYRDKSFRKAKTPFNALQLIKDEVLAGKFSKYHFRDFTSCLTK